MLTMIKNTQSLLLIKYLLRYRNTKQTKSIQIDRLFEFSFYHQNKYQYSYRGNQSKYSDVLIPEQKITLQIEDAKNVEQLKCIFNLYHDQINYIHLTAFLQKVTKKQFENDYQFVEKIIKSIKTNWDKFYQDPDHNNSRAIANIICYMSRKVKRHHLDQEFSKINFFKLTEFLNPKQFVMTITGLLKLNLVTKIFSQNSDLEKLIIEFTQKKLHPGLLVSLWFNFLKFQKSTLSLNDHFAELLKNKHLKNNLIDYTQMVYCYVNSMNSRTVDCKYAVLTYPTQNRNKNQIGAHQLSLLFEQLSKLKQITDIYFSETFIQFLHQCYLTVLNQKDIPLRNIANVFNNLVLFEEPSEHIVKETFSKYYLILKNEIQSIQNYKVNNLKRSDVDALSYVSLFHHLMSFKQPQQNYKKLASISIRYLEKILPEQKIMKQYNDRTFLRLLTTLQLSKSKIYKNFNETLILADNIKGQLQRQILKRIFSQKSLGMLMSSVTYLQIKSKNLCRKFKTIIETMEKSQKKIDENGQFNYSQRLKQCCILSKQGINCLKCFQ